MIYVEIAYSSPISSKRKKGKLTKTVHSPPGEKSKDGRPSKESISVGNKQNKEEEGKTGEAGDDDTDNANGVVTEANESGNDYEEVTEESDGSDLDDKTRRGGRRMGNSSLSRLGIVLF